MSSTIEKVEAINRLVNGESSSSSGGSSTLPDNWEVLLASKQDTLIAGDGIAIVDDTISMIRGTEQVFGPPAISDNARQYGWYGTLQMLGLPEGMAYSLTEITAYRRQSDTPNADLPLYMRVLRKNEDNAWRVAYQSPTAQTMGSFTLEGTPMSWTLKNVDASPSIPTDERVFICWVDEPNAPANTAKYVGFKPTTAYAGLYDITSETIPVDITDAQAYDFGMALRIRAYVETEDSIEWTEVTGKPTSFTPASHTHTIANVTGLQTALDGKQATLTAGDNITISNGVISATSGSSEGDGVDLTAVKEWVNGQGTDENGNISRTNLNNRGTSIVDTKYVSDGGTISDILASVNNDGVTPAQIQSAVDANGNAGISSNVTTTTNIGTQATVRARHINPSTGTIAQAALIASSSGTVKLLLSDGTNSLEITPTTQLGGSSSSTTDTTDHTHASLNADELSVYIDTYATKEFPVLALSGPNGVKHLYVADDEPNGYQEIATRAWVNGVLGDINTLLESI